MDDNTKQDYNHEDSHDVENQIDKTNKGLTKKVTSVNSISHSTWQNGHKARTQSRSRSPNGTKNSKQWISSSAFINFVQDIRQNYPGTRSTRICQLAGEKWRKMSPEEKQPYLDAAKIVRDKKYNQRKKEHANMNNVTTEQKPNGNMQKQSQERTKKVQRKTNKRSKKKATSDSESVTSGTTATATSEDLSDMSS